MDAAEALSPVVSPAISDALTERELAVLAFEKQWWKYAGAKEQAIREIFGLTAIRYSQVLNSAIEKPAALAVDPMLVRRLRRLRGTRGRVRSTGRIGFELR
jgi:hypothetical protein